MNVFFAMLAGILLMLVQFWNFGSSYKVRNPGEVSTFFDLAALLPRRQLIGLRLLSSIPLSIVFFTVCLVAPEQLNGVYVTLLNAGGEQVGMNKDVLSLFESFSQSFAPIALLVVVFLFFWKYYEILAGRIDKLIILAFGITRRFSDLAENVARVLLQVEKGDRSKIVRKISAQLGGQNPPLAEELVGAPAINQVAYQLLYVARPNVATLGLNGAMRSLIDDMKYDTNAEPFRFPAQRSWAVNGSVSGLRGRYLTREVQHGFAALTMYVFLCALYVLFVPWLGFRAQAAIEASQDLLGGAGSASNPALLVSNVFGVEWPHPDHRDDLALEICQFTMNFIVVFCLGFIVFRYRRGIFRQNESIVQSLIVVFSVQILFAAAMQAMFKGIYMTIHPDRAELWLF
jgi:hypothetical protein